MKSITLNKVNINFALFSKVKFHGLFTLRVGPYKDIHFNFNAVA